MEVSFHTRSQRIITLSGKSKKNNLVVLYFRCVVKPHVFKLQWHSAGPKYFKLWERQIGRKNFKVTKNTKVCSNHFVFGKPLGEHLHPELWLHGYDSDKSATLQYRSKGLQHYTRAMRVYYTRITRSVHAVPTQCTRSAHAVATQCPRTLHAPYTQIHQNACNYTRAISRS